MYHSSDSVAAQHTPVEARRGPTGLRVGSRGGKLLQFSSGASHDFVTDSGTVRYWALQYLARLGTVRSSTQLWLGAGGYCALQYPAWLGAVRSRTELGSALLHPVARCVFSRLSYVHRRGPRVRCRLA